VTTANQAIATDTADATGSRPTFIVHDLAQAGRVAQVAAAQPVRLISGPGAGGTLGPAVFMGIIDQTKSDHPDADIIACLDCADEPGTALNALRHGIEEIILAGPEEVVVKIADMAGKQGASVHPRPTHALDMVTNPDCDEIERWIAGSS